MKSPLATKTPPWTKKLQRFRPLMKDQTPDNDRLSALVGFLKEDPDDSFTRFAIAQEYRMRGNSERALHHFEELIEADPSYVGVYYHLGKLYEQLGRTDDAIATYENGVARAATENDAHARAELQNALMKMTNDE